MNNTPKGSVKTRKTDFAAPDGGGQAMSRRSFLGTSAGAGAALLATGLESLSRASNPPAAGADETEPWFEATTPQLQALMASGALTSRALTLAYLHRIDRLNPLLNAVIET